MLLELVGALVERELVLVGGEGLPTVKVELRKLGGDLGRELELSDIGVIGPSRNLVGIATCEADGVRPRFADDPSDEDAGATVFHADAAEIEAVLDEEDFLVCVLASQLNLMRVFVGHDCGQGRVAPRGKIIEERAQTQHEIEAVSLDGIGSILIALLFFGERTRDVGTCDTETSGDQLATQASHDSIDNVDISVLHLLEDAVLDLCRQCEKGRLCLTVDHVD